MPASVSVPNFSVAALVVVAGVSVFGVRSGVVVTPAWADVWCGFFGMLSAEAEALTEML